MPRTPLIGRRPDCGVLADFPGAGGRLVRSPRSFRSIQWSESSSTRPSSGASLAYLENDVREAVETGVPITNWGKYLR